MDYYLSSNVRMMDSNKVLDSFIIQSLCNTLWAEGSFLREVKYFFFF